MKTINFKKRVLPHGVAIVIFYLLTAFYFSPLFSGKTLDQADINHGAQVTHQIRDFKKTNGKAAMWNPYTFSGMPAYIFGVELPGQNIKSQSLRALSFFVKSPANIVLLTLISCYILFLCYKVNPYLAMMGSIAFAFGTFNIISIEFGHNAKIRALAFLPLIFAGIKLLWDKKWLIGSAVGLLGFVYLFHTGHYQIAFYTSILLVIQFFIKGIFAFKENSLPEYGKVVAITAIIAFGGILSNIGNLWIISDYQSESIRGKQILQSKKQDITKSKSGLDRDYVFAWSQGIQESFTLFIHNSYGGGSAEHYNTKKLESYKYLKKKGVKKNQAKGLISQSMYWGNQPFTAGAIYVGATICFFFVIALFFLPLKESLWLCLGTLFFLMLSWGSNFETLNYFLFDHLPFYNKFRTVSMTLGVVNFTLVVGGVIGIQQLLDSSKTTENIKKLCYAFGITGGILVLFWLFSDSIFDFVKKTDELAQFTQMFGNKQFADEFFDLLILDRMALFSADVLRTLLFTSMSFALLFFYLKGILKLNIIAIGLLTLTTIDIITIDKLYLTKENFKKIAKNKKVKPTKADREILALNKDGKRVFVAGGGMNDSPTAYFHKSMGGYHPAKMRRYQDLADFHFTGQPTIGVLQMMNAGYMKQGPQNFVEIPNSLGHAWFIHSLKPLSNADSVINSLYTINPELTAVINEKDFDVEKTNFVMKGHATIQQTTFSPNKITYKSNNSNDGYAVFSEVYYNKGWEAYIDGKPVNYQRVNYILRGMNIPSGKHLITFEFKPTSYIVGGQLNLIFSILTLLYSFGVIGFLGYRDLTTEED
tara:strand:+ start:2722 stop:5175 length:2454 start_codon:yes stop_codon:yes gene_type:complete